MSMYTGITGQLDSLPHIELNVLNTLPDQKQCKRGVMNRNLTIGAWLVEIMIYFGLTEKKITCYFV